MDAYAPVMLSSALGDLSPRHVVDKPHRKVHFAKLAGAINEKRSHIAARRNKIVSPKALVHGIWKRRDSDEETVSEDSQGHSTEASLAGSPWAPAQSSGQTREDRNPQDQAVPVQATDVRHSNASCGGESDAVSDTSFTPPKKLNKFVRIDDEGRRHVLAPSGFRDQAPFKHKSRFIHIDLEGKRHLLPPPGFRGLFPMKIEEHPVVRCTLSFKRRDDFKKAETQCGGISLAVLEEKNAPRAETKIRFNMEPMGPMPTGYRPISPSERAIPTSMPPPPPSPTDRRVAGWSSQFAKNLFEAENELLYDGPWPISTF
ncbi:hypothetical protein GGR51DRAFT_556739 [Nemania sp. FL0031]|nr:hypothetical protein GGR51DRAFT_556739 [Nemania sp. FL0031]